MHDETIEVAKLSSLFYQGIHIKFYLAKSGFSVPVVSLSGNLDCLALDTVQVEVFSQSRDHFFLPVGVKFVRFFYRFLFTAAAASCPVQRLGSSSATHGPRAFLIEIFYTREGLLCIKFKFRPLCSRTMCGDAADSIWGELTSNGKTTRGEF